MLKHVSNLISFKIQSLTNKACIASYIASLFLGNNPKEWEWRLGSNRIIGKAIHKLMLPTLSLPWTVGDQSC